MIKTRKQAADCPALHDSAAGLGSEPDGSIPQPHYLYFKVRFNITFMSNKWSRFFMFFDQWPSHVSHAYCMFLPPHPSRLNHPKMACEVYKL
jgi:hypothetical protein